MTIHTLNLNKKIEIIAHRGASAITPENTIVSFLEAVKAGSDIIEFDAHLSRDNEVIIIHDNTVNRTTDGLGKIRDLTLPEIKKLDAGSWFSAEFEGERIPTLDELLQKDFNGVKLNIELKGALKEYEQFPEIVIKKIRKYDAVNRVVITSFNTDFLKRVMVLDAEIPFGIISNFKIRNHWEISLKKNASQINPLWYFVNKTFVKKAHKYDVRVYPWTINRKYIVLWLLKMGIDGMITDHPEKLIKILEAKGLR